MSFQNKHLLEVATHKNLMCNSTIFVFVFISPRDDNLLCNAVKVVNSTF